MNKKLISFLVLGVFVFTLALPTGRVLADSDASIEALQKRVSELLRMVQDLQAQIMSLRGQTQPVTPVTPQPTQPDRGWEKVTGTLQVATPSAQMWGSHTITTDEGKSWAVKAVNNDALEMLNKYSGQRVTLWGQLQYQNLEGGFWGFVAKKVYPEGYGCAIPAKVKIGYKGDDVRIVQQYLATDVSIYPEGLVTGYYGPLTKKAIEKFQKKNGLRVSGEFDDDTKEELEIEIETSERVRCIPRPIPVPIPDQGFNVYSPSKGEEWKVGQTYKIAWTQVWPTIAPTTTGSTSTSFAPVGPVKITLHHYIPCLYEGPVRCMIAEAAPYVITASTENDGVFEWTIPADLVAGYRDGKLIIMVTSLDGGMSGRSGVFEIESSNSGSNKPPVINGVSGPTSLRVGETGTWTVKAYDPENGSLSYSVLWGDEPSTAVLPGIGVAPAPIQNTATFTHVYNSAGKFTPVFYVTDDRGQQAKTSMSVVVGSVSANRPPEIVGIPSVPSDILTGQVINFTWSAKDPDGDVMSWSVSWGEGLEMGMACAQPSGGLVTDNCGTFNASHAWTLAGTFQVKATVRDGKGGSDEHSFNVTVVNKPTTNQPPVIKTFQFQNGVTSLTVGQMYILNYLAVDSEGTQVKYTIDFGDGTIETENMFGTGTTGASLHTYTTAGTKTLKLTATDAQGLSATQSLTVNVVSQNLNYQILNLNQGWNFVSFYRLPDGRDLRNIFTDPYFSYVDVIKTVENGQEQIYDRANNVNTLMTIQFDNGYKIYANRAFSMYVYGSLPTQAERTTHLVRGLYNLVGYPSETTRRVDQVFSSSGSFINAMISSVKDAAGNLWTPGYPNWIGDMKPGQGYEVWINPEFTNNQDIDFTFPQ